MESTGNSEIAKLEKVQFKREVVIHDKPYIFEGKLPAKPSNFLWTVSLPNWKDQKPLVDQMIKEGKINFAFLRELRSYHLGNGKVGMLDIEKVVPKDQGLGVRINMVQTNTDYLPTEFGYNNAEGLGSFLLDNICTLADLMKWRLYLVPIDKGGRLSQMELNKWYRRKGFEDKYKYPKESQDPNGGLQRMPQTPDISRVIADILQASQVK